LGMFDYRSGNNSIFALLKAVPMKGVTNCCFVILTLVSIHVFSQTGKSPKIYECRQTAVNINVDGLADETAWQEAAWSDDFVDIEGSKKQLPEFSTRMKMLWDEKALYIFVELEEAHIWGTLTERDQIIYYDNDFEVFIDPDGDNHNYFELEVNALATSFDLFMNRPYNAGGKPLIGWDISGLECAVHANGTTNDPNDIDKKWTVEMAIPWKSMITFTPHKRPPRQGEVWRMNFSRVQWQTEVVEGEYKKIINPDTQKPIPEDNWVWSPQGVINMHLPEKWGYIVFTEQHSARKFTLLEVDTFFEEKQVLLNLYQKQKEFYLLNKRFAGSLFELDKQGRQSATHIFIEATSRQFLISSRQANGATIFIDHNKRIWVE